MIQWVRWLISVGVLGLLMQLGWMVQGGFTHLSGTRYWQLAGHLWSSHPL